MKKKSPIVLVKSKTFYRSLPLAIALFLLLTGSLILESLAMPPRPAAYESFLTRIVTQLMATQHYSRQRLDDEVATQIFDEYIKVLDPNRRFFLQSDIDEFSQKKKMIDDYLQRGHLDFAFDIYERLLQRVEARVDYARERLQQPFDFTVEEEIIVDRSDVPWAKTSEELDEVWRKQLKNRVLTYILMHEGDAEDTDKAAQEGAVETDDAQTVQPQEAPDPVERTLAIQKRHLRYLKENDSIDVLELFLGSMARVFDPHSSYMAPRTEEDFDINMSLSLEGIGAVLTADQGYVKIVNIVPGGPADQAGTLQEGDRIIAVRQEDEEQPVDVIDMPLRKVVRLIRGPKGTAVNLTILKADSGISGVPTRINIVRDEIKLKEQEARAEIRNPDFSLFKDDFAPDKQKSMIPESKAEESRFMVITLPSFYSDFKGRREGEEEYKSASRDVKKLLLEAADEDLDGVILDLRGNGGGSLEEAIKIAGFFFEEGPVVQVRHSSGKTQVYNDPAGELVYDGPLVVMVDRLSASASEIVAAAIKDHNRGVIIGNSSTHGKGTVQTVLELNRFIRSNPLFQDKEAGSLKFTIAKFYRVNGSSTQRRGVKAHVKFPSFTDHMDLGEASLENAMVWDAIDSIEINHAIDVSPYLTTLQNRAQVRLENNPEYTKFLEAIERFAAIRERNSLPLSIEKRRVLNKDEEEWLAEIRSQITRRRTYEPKDENAELDELEQTPEDSAREPITEITQDLVLDEALRVLADLVCLHKGDLLADPAAQE